MEVGYRIVSSGFSSDAFSGYGAREYGGRWNSIGTSIVYLAENASLAQLEVLVHLDNTMLLVSEFSLIEIRFDADLVEHFATGLDWRQWRTESIEVSRHIGDEWAREQRSPLLRVPSVLSPEYLYLMNPAHPDATKITITDPISLTFDERLAD